MLFFIFSLLSVTSLALAGDFHPPPIDFDSEQSHRLWLNYSNQDIDILAVEDSIAAATRAGMQLHAWLAVINESRSEHPITLTSAQTRSGSPIVTPKMYSPKLIFDRLLAVRRKLPPIVSGILFGELALTSELPSGLSMDRFRAYLFQVDRIYQAAVRWQTVM
tara:strand:+ start:411 stop:899 length:489 start_codon:yes stop_codon:yes gene_type:complete